MPHPAKLLARLNAKTVRFNTGQGGGAPSLTPEDIAAAIAFVPAGLARELMCFLHWPDGAALTENQLGESLMSMLMAEWVRREDAYQVARTRLAVHSHTPGLRSATRAFGAASDNRWPAIVKAGRHDAMQPVEAYRKVRVAVLTELRAGDYCVPCEGEGRVMTRGEVSDCENCGGTGHRKTSDRWRAKAIGVHLSAYQRSWAPVYEWLIAECRTLISEAEGEFSKAVA